MTCFAGLTAASPFVPAPEYGLDGGSGDDGNHQHHHRGPSTYHFQYSVNDPSTGDVKSHNEVSDEHGTVKGTYSLVEPDGAIRVVEYTADDVHGFRAEVKRIEPQRKGSAADGEHGHPSQPQHVAEHQLYVAEHQPYVPDHQSHVPEHQLFSSR